MDAGFLPQLTQPKSFAESPANAGLFLHADPNFDFQSPALLVPLQCRLVLSDLRFLLKSHMPGFDEAIPSDSTNPTHR